MMEGSDTDAFQIQVIPPDEQGCRFCIEKYKPFRLTALREDPDAFGSTYARELEFDDEAWLGRIKNPSAMTFVAVRVHDDQVVASTSLIGPLPSEGPVSNPYQTVSQLGTKGEIAADKILRFQMAAVYTSPKARSRGLAKALIKAATEKAIKRATEQDRPLALSVVVYAANNAAISVYERCGFVKSDEGPKLVFNACKNTSEEQIDMFYQFDASR
ncbi:hypothetical protein F5Y18DRAFT_385180 [Xylariaceae sp. FL1019]|nr:hypothetical protein F5Y18DRAFT_385180 [Xylariaceae sp. FL1019]